MHQFVIGKSLHGIDQCSYPRHLESNGKSGKRRSGKVRSPVLNNVQILEQHYKYNQILQEHWLIEFQLPTFERRHELR